MESADIPNAPSVSSSISNWLGSMSDVISGQNTASNAAAAQQLALTQQYALPMAEALKSAQESLYPEYTNLRDIYTSQVKDELTGGVPSYLQDVYRNELKAGLGSNIGSGVGSDYLGTNMATQAYNYRNAAQQKAAGLFNQLGTVTPQTVSGVDYLSGYTPSSIMNYDLSNYSTRSQIAMQQAQAKNQQMMQYIQAGGAMLAAPFTGGASLMAVPGATSGTM